MSNSRKRTMQRDDRRTSASSEPYSKLSLKDRISSKKERISSHDDDQGQTSTKKQSLAKNPLYNLLNNGTAMPSKMKEVPRLVAKERSAPDTKTLSSRAVNPKEVVLPANRAVSDHTISIRGSGARKNTFTFRGASSTTVIFKNLAPGVSQADMVTAVNERVGEIEACDVYPVKGGLSTTAEIKFGSRIAAEKAISEYHGQLADNKRLEVTIMLQPDQVAEITPPMALLNSRQPSIVSKESNDANDLFYRGSTSSEQRLQDERTRYNKPLVRDSPRDTISKSGRSYGRYDRSSRY